MTRPGDELLPRLNALRAITETHAERLPDEVRQRAAGVVGNASGRLGHGLAHTVVALAGATGSGKSSLFNAIAGAELAPTSARRPTTASARSATFGTRADDLLDWLEVDHRHVLQQDDLGGLVLLDLPDHDSTAATHRAEVDRLVSVVDVFCWVVDPQKYADAALHDEYLQRFAGHGAVTIVALNQIDRLRADERRSCMSDLARLLNDDGLTGVRIIATSATTREGVDELRRELAARTAERRAVVTRLQADVDWVAGEIFSSCGDTTRADVPSSARDALVGAAGRAAGVDVVADAVAAAYRHRGVQSFGWPPVRWMRRFRPDPLRRLGLRSATAGAGARSDRRRDRGSMPGTPSAEAVTTIRRTALPTPDPAAAAALGTAGRDLLATVSEGMPAHWEGRVGQIVDRAMHGLADATDSAIGEAELPVQPPAWWRAAGLAQRLVTAAFAAGLSWLAVLFVLAWFRVPDPPTPEVNGWPLPTLLALGGLVLGLLIAFAGRRLVGVGARRRRSQARDLLHRRIASVVDTTVVAPTTTELVALRDLADRARTL